MARGTAASRFAVRAVMRKTSISATCFGAAKLTVSGASVCDHARLQIADRAVDRIVAVDMHMNVPFIEMDHRHGEISTGRFQARAFPGYRRIERRARLERLLRRIKTDISAFGPSP